MKKLFFFLTLLFSFVVISCDPDDPDGENEEEAITSVTYILTPNGGGTPVSLTFSDKDGDGGNAPTIVGGTLENGKTYTGSITFLNETVSPAENITLEVVTEGEDHQVFYTPSSSLSSAVQVAYTDKDAKGNPIGVTSTLTTKAAAKGTLKVVLRHEPNKTASGVKDGNIANAGGETDVEVEFPVEVK